MNTTRLHPSSTSLPHPTQTPPMRLNSPLRFVMTHSRGYTIIVVMLVLILLSGLGIIALNTVNVGVRESGLQTLHQQAFDTSNSAMLLFSEYAGSNAQSVFQAYKSDYNQHGSGAARSTWAYRITDTDMMKTIFNSSGGGDSLFSNFPTDQTWEQNRQVNYDVVIRDLSDGIPAPGYSESFCFKRVLIGGESTVGNRSNRIAGENGTTFANAITAQETLIGPIRCNN